MHIIVAGVWLCLGCQKSIEADGYADAIVADLLLGAVVAFPKMNSTRVANVMLYEEYKRDIMIILNDGTYYEPDDEYLIQLQQAYSTVDVFAELNAMAMWCDANPKKRKTPRGIKQFITSWLKRAADQERGISPFAAKMQENSGKIAMKQWSQLDSLTHDFLNSEKYRSYCLQKYGQYVTYDGERVTT